MGVYKRPDSDVWWYEFELNKKRYRGSTKTTSKRDAQAVMVDKRREAQEDQQQDRLGVKRSTLYAIALKWLEASETTHADHKNNLSRVRKLFGDELVQEGRAWVLKEGNRPGLPKDLMIHEITQETLVTLKGHRMKEGNSAATINREISLVQSLMGYAQSLSIVMPTKPIVWSERRNRAASLKMKESKGKLRWLTLEEEQKLLKELKRRVRPGDRSASDNLDLVTMLLDTGARYEEVAGLRWPQVDLEGAVIHLYRSKVDNEGGVRMTKRVLAILKHRREETRGRTFVFPAHVITGQGTTDWDRADDCRGHATGAIQAAIDACELNDDPTLDRVTPHTLRDTYASRLVQAGVSLLKVSHLLGHADESMTKKYAHLCPDMTGREAAAVLDGLHAD